MLIGHLQYVYVSNRTFVFILDNRQPIVTMPVGGALLPDRYTQANQSTFTFQADENKFVAV